MRKLILALVLMTGMVCAANAQVDGKAIGVRFGLGGDLSYQHPLGSANRLEADSEFLVGCRSYRIYRVMGLTLRQMVLMVRWCGWNTWISNRSFGLGVVGKLELNITSISHYSCHSTIVLHCMYCRLFTEVTMVSVWLFVTNFKY